MDFHIPSEVEDFRGRIAAFVEEHVLPLEADRAAYDAYGNIALPALETLRSKARAEGLWCLQLKPETGGRGLGKVGMAVCYEAMNRSIFGPVVFNAAAPDDGNMMVLEALASEAQKEAWLKPIVEGRVRSAFAMTEPHPGGGSDPSMIRTKAEKRGDRYFVTGRKWFITGAEEASHFILDRAHVGRSAPRPHRLPVPQGPAGMEHCPPHRDHGPRGAWRPLRARVRRARNPGGKYTWRGRARPEGYASAARAGAADPLHALARPVEALRRDRQRLCGRAHGLRQAARRARKHPDDAWRPGDAHRDRPACW